MGPPCLTVFSPAQHLAGAGGWRAARGWPGGLRGARGAPRPLSAPRLPAQSIPSLPEGPSVHPMPSAGAWSTPSPSSRIPVQGGRRSCALTADPPVAAVPVAGVTCHRCHSAPIQPAATARGQNTNEAHGAAGSRVAPPRRAAQRAPPGTCMGPGALGAGVAATPCKVLRSLQFVTASEVGDRPITSSCSPHAGPPRHVHGEASEATSIPWGRAPQS